MQCLLRKRSNSVISSCALSVCQFVKEATNLIYLSILRGKKAGFVARTHTNRLVHRHTHTHTHIKIQLLKTGLILLE